MRFWRYSVSIVKGEKIYNLLPLTIFKHRRTLQRVAEDRSKLLEEKERLREDIVNLGKEIKWLIQKHELEGKDVHKIELAMTNLIEYLNSKYIKDENFDKEVITMTKTLYRIFR